jgi:hypothetical protein
MKLPPTVKDTRRRYVETFPVPQGEPSPAFEDRVRRWTVAFIEQVAFELPGEGWGPKRGDQGRPLSKDSIANNQVVPGRLLGWDLLLGTGTGRPTLIADPNSRDITGQYFETRPAFFQPQDHLGGSPPPPDPPPPAAVIPYNEAYAIEFGQACNATYHELNTPVFTTPVDPGMVSVHSQRAAWDYYVGGLAWPASKQKHVNEFRAVYGLEPV